MRTINRTLASVLACVMMLFSLTACGSSGSSTKTPGSIIISTLANSGITATETEEMDKAAAAYAAAWEDATKTYAESIKAAVDAGGDYETAKKEAVQAVNTAIKPYLQNKVDKVYWPDIEDNGTVYNTAKSVAESLIKDKASGKTVKEFGYAVGVGYNYDATANEITKTNKLFVFVVYE